jgi:hypothetical protein
MVMDDPLLGVKDDGLEDLSGVELTVGATAPAAAAALSGANEKPDTKVCSVSNLVSNAYSDHANMTVR